ncbi:MAG: MMPL family transporter [Planctomycetia bacterium]|nr:MMPL family transporter [Planctomycetia bacterium]
MSPTPAQALSETLVAWRWPLLALGAVLAAASLWPASRLGFDRSIEAMFAPDDPLLPPYHQLKRTFGGNEVVLAAYVDADLMTVPGLARVQALTERLGKVEGVRASLSLTSTPAGTNVDSLGPKFMELMEGYVVSADHRTAGVVCILHPQPDGDRRTATIRELRAVVEGHNPPGVLAGEPVMVIEGFQAVEDDGSRLGLLSTLLLMAVILLCFRSVRWMVLPIAVVQLALLMTKALLVTSRMRLSMVSSMLWAIVTVVGIATVVHIIMAFREGRKSGAAPPEALALAGRALASAILWSVLTTAAGFGSLLAASVGPVHDFGLMMALGTLLAMAAMAFVIPGLALAGRIDADPKRVFGEGRLDALLVRLLEGLLRRPKTIAVILAVLSVAGALGNAFLDVETDFTRNFRESSSVVRSYRLVEANLGGAGVWDVMLPAPDVLDDAYLKRVRRLQERLRQDVPGLTKTLSLADVVDAAPGAAALLPTKLKIAYLKQSLPALVDSLHGRDPDTGCYYARIMLRARERQPSREKQNLILAVERIGREEFPPRDGDPLTGAQTTGFFVLLASLIESMVRDQWVTFSIASGAIYLMMLVAVRSFRLAAIAMVPNVVPILVITGAMGWLGVKINMGAVMIAAVSIGMSIDSSIHYLIGYQRLRASGHESIEALRRVQETVGRAASLSTLALIVGFSALVVSEFVPTIYFGSLVSLAMLGGLCGNVVFLPLLLHLFGKGDVRS